MSSESNADPEAQERARREREVHGGATLSVEVAGENADSIAEKAFAAALAAVDHAPAVDPIAEDIESYAGIIGGSAPMRALFRMLDRIKSSSATVLVLGENGTGKELVAHAIHAQSKRANQEFVATNCSAFNDNLLESELFGHRRGAFTGAVVDKPGLFQVADNGTFFMDEVGDMSPALQVKLLRVLQEGVFTPVGGTETKKVDVRIIAATNRDLTNLVKTGVFREDLYYRLHVVSLRVPPLRERKDDIPRLVACFLGRLAERDGRTKILTQRAYAQLAAHEWPGNVRELENEMERVWVLSGDETVIDEDLLSASVRRTRPGISQPRTTPAPQTPAPQIPEAGTTTLPEAVEALERRMISDELGRNKGNKTRTAEALGISRRNLIRKVQGYGLQDAGRSGRPRD
ncbi:sigma 54-interacting transcriptional regulator [bacterium AH-315-N03]|nr:sigma 54-interacting transcriptional regulator [bacterium AH-315-N03]